MIYQYIFAKITNRPPSGHGINVNKYALSYVPSVGLVVNFPGFCTRVFDKGFGIMGQKCFKLDRNHAAYYLSERSGLDIADSYLAIDTLCDFIYESVCAGFDVHFRQLGTFRLQKHKGHAVQFGASGTKMDPYPVLKFKPMVSVSHKLRERDDSNGIMWDVPAELEVPESNVIGDKRIEEVLNIRHKRVNQLFKNMGMASDVDVNC